MKMKKLIVITVTLFCAALFSVLLNACDYSQEKKTYNFDQETITLTVGDTVKLNLITYEDITEAEWSVDDETVASVKNGEVTGIKGGETIIRVSFNNGEGACTVIVKEKSGQEEEKTADAYNISINKITDKICAGETANLSAVVYVNGNPIVAEIVWSSSDETVATVTNGQVTAINNGKTDIVATYENGNVVLTAKCEITVCPFTVLSAEKQVIIDGQSDYSLKIDCYIENVISEGENFSYESSDTDVVTVDASGKLYFVNKGDAFITVTHENKANIVVQVKCVEKIVNISQPSEFLEIDGADANNYYVLTNDIDLTDTELTFFRDRGAYYNDETRKVHTYSSGVGGVYSIIDEFNGTLDGNGHKIIFNNYSSSETKFNVMGLFNYIAETATIKNLFIDSMVTTYAKLGGAGNLPCTGTVAYVNKGVIENCYLKSTLNLKNLAAAKTQFGDIYQERIRASMIFEQHGVIKDCIVKFNVYDLQNANAVEGVRAVFIGGVATTVYDNVIVITEGQRFFATSYLAGATTTAAPVCSGYVYANVSDMINGINGKQFVSGSGGSNYNKKAYLGFGTDVWTFNEYEGTAMFYTTVC